MELKKYGPIILRYALSLVFLYFGISQLTSVAEWTAWVPSFASNIMPAATIVTINGTMEIILGLMLILGIFTRIVALLLGLHLVGIAASIGFNPIGVRDFGLSLATLSIFFTEPDEWCLEWKWKNKNPTN